MNSNTLSIANQTFTGTPKQPGRDNHAHEPRETYGVATNIQYTNCIFDANGASEALKLSNAWQIEVYGGRSIGGVEDCVDIVRGGDITFRLHEFEQNGAQQCVTLKGGARRVNFYDCGGLRKIVIGDYSKYDAHATYPDGRTVYASPFQFARPQVRDVCIFPRVGEPLPSVTVWHGDRPYIADGTAKPHNEKDFVIPQIVTRVYFWTRAKFFKEALPAPDGEFVLSQDEI